MALNSESSGRPANFFKRATAVVCACNLIAIFYILYAIMSPLYLYSTASSSLAAFKYALQQPEVMKLTQEEAARIREAFEARRALEPVDLIKRVKEIEEESRQAVSKESWSVASRKKLASDLAQRLKELKGASGKSNQQALEEWRKKKLDEAQKRGTDLTGNHDKNVTKAGEVNSTVSTDNLS